MTNEPFDCPPDIFDMHPAIHLSAASLPAAQPAIDQTPVGYKHPSFSQCDRHAQRNLARERGPLFKEGPFPALAYLYRKPATLLSGIFILRPVLRMPVDGGRCRVDPQLGWHCCLADRLPDRKSVV